MGIGVLFVVGLGLTEIVPAEVIDEFVISRQSVPQCVILVPQAEESALEPLASELCSLLGQIIGSPIEIKTFEGSEPPTGIVLALTTLGLRLPDPQSLPLGELTDYKLIDSEGFALVSTGGRLWVIANTHLGLQHAIYSLLQRVGCRWFFPDPIWTVIPRTPDLALRICTWSRPAFAHRRIWYGYGAQTPKLQADYQAWLRHNRQLGSFGIDCGHAYERYIPSHMFEKRPEFFALVEGKRQPTQVCTSNPEVQQRIITQVLEVFRTQPARNMVSVEPNDGDRYCECDGCLALGSPSDRVFHLANLVAEAVRREFLDKWVGLYAYAGHSEPPSFRLQPGVYVQVTTGFRYTKLSFEEQVRQFREKGAAVGVYDYFSVYPWDWDLPGAAKAGRIFQLAESIKNYHALGLTTYDAESSCNWGPNGLGYWMAAQLMWNPELDPRELAADFCRHAFEEAAEPIWRIYRRWSEGHRFSQRELKLALDDLAEAYERNASPEVRERLDRLAAYLHWLHLVLDYERTVQAGSSGQDKTAWQQEWLRRAEELCVYSRRLMDTGMIHTYPMLFSEWFEHRFKALERIEGFDWQLTESWKSKRTDLPTQEEVAAWYQADRKSLQHMPAFEVPDREYAGPLVPAVECLPDTVAAWKQVTRSKVAIETAEYFFLGKEGEIINIHYQPFDRGHTIDCPWQLRTVMPGLPALGEILSEGRLQAEKGEPATLALKIPASGLLGFVAGTDYWKAAELDWGERPVSFWAGCADSPKDPRRLPLRFWWPRLQQPLYFYVPKGLSHFIIAVPSGGNPYTEIDLRLANGTEIVQTRLLAGGELVVQLKPRGSHPGYEGPASEALPSIESAPKALASTEAKPRLEARTVGEQTPDETSPSAFLATAEGADGQIWAIGISGLRCVLEIYGVPPFLAKHPRDLLVPLEAVNAR